MIKFRPHHFLCTLGFEGKGYSEEFVRNYAQIADQLRTHPTEGDQVPIQVVELTDSICRPCPNRQEQSCVSEEKINKLDQAHSNILEIKAGDTLTWGEAKKRIAQRMTQAAFHQACAPCAWKSLGVCEKALVKLISTRS